MSILLSHQTPGAPGGPIYDIQADFDPIGQIISAVVPGGVTEITGVDPTSYIIEYPSGVTYSFASWELVFNGAYTVLFITFSDGVPILFDNFGDYLWANVAGLMAVDLRIGIGNSPAIPAGPRRHIG